MLEDLQNQETLFCFQHIRQSILLHGENFVFDGLREFAALVNSEIAALLLGGAVGHAFGNF